MTVDQNCISHWFPRIKDCGVDVPRTEIVTTKVKLRDLIEGKSPRGLRAFLGTLTVAMHRIAPDGGPVFLRTGQGSGKHDWEKTCYVANRSKIAQHVQALVEWSEEVDILGLATNVWAVREFLQLEAPFRAFGGKMPIAREYRCFLVGGEFTCLHSYWLDDAIYGADDEDWRTKLSLIQGISAEVYRECADIVCKIAKVLDGDWSIDVCRTVDGRWVVTDLAEAGRSYHDPSCKFCPEHMKPKPEPEFDESILINKAS